MLTERRSPDPGPSLSSTNAPVGHPLPNFSLPPPSQDGVSERYLDDSESVTTTDAQSLEDGLCPILDSNSEPDEGDMCRILDTTNSEYESPNPPLSQAVLTHVRSDGKVFNGRKLNGNVCSVDWVGGNFNGGKCSEDTNP